MSRSLSNTSRYLLSCASSSVASGVRVAGAGVGHRRSEHPLVEGVGDVVVVVDRFGVAGAAVPEPLHRAAPPGQHLLRRRRDGHQVLDADGADDVGQHPRRRPVDLDSVVEGLEQLVRVARVHTVEFEVPRHVGADQPQLARRGRQVGGAARGHQVETEGVLGSGRTAVVRGEAQRKLDCAIEVSRIWARDSLPDADLVGHVLPSTPSSSLHRLRVEVEETGSRGRRPVFTVR